MKILIDTNVLIDYLVAREPFFEPADNIMKLCIEKKVTGYMAAHSVTNMFFILRKEYKPIERRILIKSLLDILYVSGVGTNELLNALNRDNFEDFEDCLQDECAAKISADYIVTRNIKDYQNSAVPAITPDEFLKLI